QYGMSNVLGPVAYGGDPAQQYYLGQPQKNYSEEVAREIDKEVQKFMEEAYEACRTIINENRDKLEKIAQALIDKETLSAEELKEIVFGATETEIEKPPAVIEEPPPVTVDLTKPTEVEQPKIPDMPTPI
ncbi:MAG: cell division protein FtsH, partial [Selenomonadaceae bacterium]|nr:cell division protein FtsH [Selenomonadaceae bacterium]